ncbi:MAG: PAS domain S-box protein [Desulfamplus sp.]|nr:PAS domain S-box protein [Desulfamplus sp.]
MVVIEKNIIKGRIMIRPYSQKKMPNQIILSSQISLSPAIIVFLAALLLCSLAALVILLIRSLGKGRRIMELTAQNDLQFRSLFTHAPGGMAMVSYDGWYLKANHSFCNMLGYSEEELQQINWKDITHPDDIAVTENLVKGLRLSPENKEDYCSPDSGCGIMKSSHDPFSTQGSTFSSHGRENISGDDHQVVEKRYINREGREIRALVSIAYLPFRQSGHPCSYILHVQDITHIHRTQKRMREREERYRQLFEADISGFYVVTTGGDVLMCNQVFALTLGYEGNARELDINIERHYKYPSLRHALIRELKEKKALKHIELDFIKCDGSPINVLLNAIGRFDSSGELMEVQGYIIDITARKNLEKKLFHAQKMEAIGTMAGGIAHDFNNLLMAVMGNTSLLLLNRDISHPDYKHLINIDSYARSGSEMIKQLLGVAKGGKYETRPIDINHLIKKNCEMFSATHGHIHVETFLSSDLWYVEGDGVQMEQVLGNLFRNAAQAMDNRGCLTVSSRNVMMEKEEDIPNTDNVPASYVLITVKDTGTGIDEEIIERIFDPFFSTKAQGHGTGLGLASAYGIVTNHRGFIDVKSSKGEGSEFRIFLPALTELSWKPDDDEFKIDRERLPSGLAYESGDLGSPDFKSKDLDSPDLESRSLSIEPPLQGEKGSSEDLDSPDLESRSLSIEPPLQGEKGSTRNPRVLLVDDEDMVLEAVSAILDHLGCHVATAESGGDALEIYRRDYASIDVVIFDMMMPDMGGDELFDEMKKINPHLKSILATGYSPNEKTHEILGKGCSGFIRKPFTIEHLSDKLNEVLGFGFNI